ncbi:MAG: large conductance mechanosensitive channel protein MscL [Clostridium sp.]|uniref:large conductance mechanosensitive channel protein MscL n=1 Tax=Clostridium sp. TaxID=1506 RepID=UPI0025C3B83C|nr:large conductance mechanosensitive channel protein MscL [Clostridium sp.]MCH3964937.1 large conductance mechanosensitive channel protein MscL [Clostridium sp.]MCI1716569.1 large conductance mechanosensitive channel protein MscL [Clostridium sp.]MCI1800949.1 large conductance mechanosensitive channel protein MscL [Clostridium sp.]MCI1814746.1 large conductance mechanosensitive channel protein MscL [Clostridium sp.]MCI1871696.1 large conductance mechanosensitive channel protein MscL [Clostrid
MWKEFKKFAMKGNILDLAIGVVIGSAFGKIVSSLVSDIIMPLAGLLIGKVDFSNLFLTLGSGHFDTIDQAKKAGVPTLNYGIFINNIIDFLIVAFSIFLVMTRVNKFFSNKEEEKSAATKKCRYCLSEIPIEATRCPNCTSHLD